VKGKHAGKIAHHDEADHAVVYLGEPIRSGYVLIKRECIAKPDQPGAGAVEAGASRVLPADGASGSSLAQRARAWQTCSRLF